MIHSCESPTKDRVSVLLILVNNWRKADTLPGKLQLSINIATIWKKNHFIFIPLLQLSMCTKVFYSKYKGPALVLSHLYKSKQTISFVHLMCHIGGGGVYISRLYCQLHCSVRCTLHRVDSMWWTLLISDVFIVVLLQALPVSVTSYSSNWIHLLYMVKKGFLIKHTSVLLSTYNWHILYTTLVIVNISYEKLLQIDDSSDSRQPC